MLPTREQLQLRQVFLLALGPASTRHDPRRSGQKSPLARPQEQGAREINSHPQLLRVGAALR